MAATFQEKYLYPPSPIYPIGGALLAYFLAKGESKPYLMFAGALAGMALNVGVSQVQKLATSQSGGGSIASTPASLFASAVGKKDTASA